MDTHIMMMMMIIYLSDAAVDAAVVQPMYNFIRHYHCAAGFYFDSCCFDVIRLIYYDHFLGALKYLASF